MVSRKLLILANKTTAATPAHRRSKINGLADWCTAFWLQHWCCWPFRLVLCTAFSL